MREIRSLRDSLQKAGIQTFVTNLFESQLFQILPPERETFTEMLNLERDRNVKLHKTIKNLKKMIELQRCSYAPSLENDDGIGRDLLLASKRYYSLQVCVVLNDSVNSKTIKLKPKRKSELWKNKSKTSR